MGLKEAEVLSLPSTRDPHVISLPQGQGWVSVALYLLAQSQRAPDWGSSTPVSTLTITPFLLWVSLGKPGHARLQEDPWAFQRAEKAWCRTPPPPPPGVRCFH